MVKYFKYFLQIPAMLILLLACFQMNGQIPSSDLYLFDIIKVEGKYDIKRARFLNDFNKESYNNQPVFFNAQTIYFSAIANGKEQTDIYALDLLRKKYWQVTDTEHGEYSPVLMPNRKSFSVIKQEAVTNIQRLWAYPVDQSDSGYDLFPEITGVGYHCWIDDENVAMFILGQPQKLIIANRTTKESFDVIENVGRSLKSDQYGNLYYIDKTNPEHWLIKKYNQAGKRSSVITEVIGKSEDFELLSDGNIITGVGSDLFIFNPKSSIKWEKITSLNMLGIKDISRIAVFGEKLVLVTNKN